MAAIASSSILRVAPLARCSTSRSSSPAAFAAPRCATPSTSSSVALGASAFVSSGAVGLKSDSSRAAIRPVAGRKPALVARASAVVAAADGATEDKRRRCESRAHLRLVLPERLLRCVTGRLRLALPRLSRESPRDFSPRVLVREGRAIAADAIASASPNTRRRSVRMWETLAAATCRRFSHFHLFRSVPDPASPFPRPATFSHHEQEDALGVPLPVGAVLDSDRRRRGVHAHHVEAAHLGPRRAASRRRCSRL